MVFSLITSGVVTANCKLPAGPLIIVVLFVFDFINYSIDVEQISFGFGPFEPMPIVHIKLVNRAPSVSDVSMTGRDGHVADARCSVY